MGVWSKPVKERTLYKETYKAGSFFDKQFLPVTKHTEVFQPRKMRLLAAGSVLIGKEEFEFHDVRLYFPKEQVPVVDLDEEDKVNHV